MADIYEKLKEMDITLPAPPPKGGVYTPVMEFGEKFLYCSGCGNDIGDGKQLIGKVGKDLTLEQGQQAAYCCMLNLLANLQDKLGDLKEILRVLRSGGRLVLVFEMLEDKTNPDKWKPVEQKLGIKAVSEEGVKEMLLRAGYQNIRTHIREENGWLCATAEKE